MTETHVTTLTRFVETDGTRFAYRRFGAGRGVPLVFMPHYRAGMDHWDPALTDGFASSRPVILFDNAGVAGSSGETPDTMEAMADNAANFLGALGASRDPKVREWADSTDPQTGESSLEAFLYLFFHPLPTSQAAGKAFWERRHRRKQDADRASTPQTMAVQRAAIIAWSKATGERNAQVDDITQPALVVNGNHDIMIPTINSYHLSQAIPNAQLIIYPDSGHGALFQFPELFVAHGRLFLDAST